MAGAAILPGSAAAYVGTPAIGMIRYSDTTPPAVIEYYDGTTWVSLGTGNVASVTGTNGVTANGNSGSPEVGAVTVDFPINLLTALP
jgi:hypothetical protein